MTPRQRLDYAIDWLRFYAVHILSAPLWWLHRLGQRSKTLHDIILWSGERQRGSTRERPTPLS